MIDPFDPFVLLCVTHGLPRPQLEYCFAPPRRWRADYCWPDYGVIVERDGGIYRGGRHPGTAIGGHSSASGILRDMSKANGAQLAGFLYLRFTVQQLASGEALPFVRAALARHATKGDPV